MNIYIIPIIALNLFLAMGCDNSKTDTSQNSISYENDNKQNDQQTPTPNATSIIKVTFIR